MVKAILALALLFPATPFDSGLPALAQDKQEPRTFTVSGTVKFDGAAPKPKANKLLEGDLPCASCHEKIPPKDDLVVAADGGVRWAFVYVKKGLEGREFKPPAEPVLVDQVGCIYTPHVAGVMTGQPVTFRNSDKMMHNVNGTAAFANKGFNKAQLPGTTDTYTFANPEVAIRIACNVHPFMAMHIAVLDHPFFAVTDADGKFEIKNLPPGTYTFRVWHEGLETTDKTNEVVVQVKAAAQVDLLMKKK
jgi:plastocyanin